MLASICGVAVHRHKRVQGPMTTAARWARAALPLALIGLLPLLAACSLLGGSQPTPTPVVASLPTTAPAPTATAPATPTPKSTPTPTPVPALTSASVEQIVFLQIRPCADQISKGRPVNIEIKVIAAYDPSQRRWVADAVSNDGIVSFGRWAVADTTGQASPLDATASTIASPGAICA